MVDFDLDDEQQQLQLVVRRWCEAQESSLDKLDPVDFVDAEWGSLADLGVLGLGTPLGGGGLVEIVVAAAELGRRACPGPIVATLFAVRLLEGERQEAVAGGTSLVSVVDPPLLPWAPRADLLVEVVDDEAWIVSAQDFPELVPTATREPWARGAVVRHERLGAVGAAAVVGDLATAAYLTGAAEQQLQSTAEYVADRHQFGQSVGAFQAVSHPLADAYVELRAATALTWIAAARHDDGQDAQLAATHARTAASRAALDSSYTVHQAMGAMGFTLEGPLVRHTLQIRQVALSPPGAGRRRSSIERSLGFEVAN